MRTRMERLLKGLAAVGGVLTLLLLLLAQAGPVGVPAWPALAAIYVTGVSFGLGDMTRLYHRHRRRCQECLSGAGPHLRWWLPRLVLVVVVSVLPVLLLLPIVGGGAGATPPGR